MLCPRFLAPALRRLAGRLKEGSRPRELLEGWAAKAEATPSAAPADAKRLAADWGGRALSLLRRLLDRLSLIIPEPPKKLREVPGWARRNFQWSLCLAAGVIGLAVWFFWPPANDPLRPRYPSHEARFRATVGVPLVRLAYVSDWPASVAAAYLAADLIRTRMLADVVFKPVGSEALPDAWGLLVNDQADVLFSAWMPAHREYLEEAGAAVRLVGGFHDDARLGLAVPAWMRVDSIADLAAYDFGPAGAGAAPGPAKSRVVYGIDPGSRLNALARRALEDYDLADFALVEKSEQFMLERLRAAMDQAQPVVVAAWSPHAMFGEFNLKFLQDPRGVFGEPGQIVTVVRSRFAEDFENLTAFLARQRLSSTEFSDLVYRTAAARNVAMEVKKWIAQHPALLRAWDVPPPPGE
ncbi:MAG: hypothetical protein J6333_04840 [Planctomycetes bacterium]|nr:hypothetical protein [Planctomycetota bacterium]